MMSLSKFEQYKPELLQKGCPAIYRLPLQTAQEDHENRIAKRELGKFNRDFPPPGKVLMLLGETGSGKTTLVNSLTNFALGVKWTDPFRFQIITRADENQGRATSEAKSQTKWITIYVIHKTENSLLPYTLTLIDTPGYGDTEGIERDQAITKQIKALVEKPSLYGLTEIHGIGLVIPATAVRLTPTQKYIYQSLLAILGKDVASNIFIIMTFSDAGKPKILDALKEEKVEIKTIYKFNNSSVFFTESTTNGNGKCDESDMMELTYKAAWKQATELFECLRTWHARTFELTSEVLRERLVLEETIRSLGPEITKGMLQLDDLEKHKKIVENNKQLLDEGKKPKIVQLKKEMHKVLLDPGTHVTNCLVCNTTCHYPCLIPNDDNKFRCNAMKEPRTPTTTCEKCDRRCSWQSHRNEQYRWTIVVRSIETTAEDILKCNKTACDTISQLERELEVTNDTVLTLMGQVHKSVKRLDEIALRPNPLSEVEYVDTLIAAELNGREPGYDNRIKYLDEVKKNTQLFAVIKNKTTESLRISWWKENHHRMFLN